MASRAEKPGSSLLDTKRRNRILIRNLIFRTPDATRVGIADELGLTLPTITTSVNEMIREGLLEELPLAKERRTGGAGRRPNIIAFRPDAAAAVGVELGPYATRAVCMDLGGNVLASSATGVADEDYGKMIRDVALQIREVLPGDLSSFLGVSVGVPGFVDREAGVIRSNRRSDWSGRSFAADLQKELGLPVIIDNNVRMRAIACDMIGGKSLPDMFAYFYISHGLACPFMLKHEVISGTNSGSGEIGHMVLAQKDGRYMEADDLAGDGAVLRTLTEKMEAGELPELEEMVAGGKKPDMHIVLELQEKGNPVVNAVMEDAIDALGKVLANAVNLLNPGVVFVDGYVMKLEKNRALLSAATRRHLFGINEEEVQIRYLSFDHFRGAKAAAYLAVREWFLNAWDDSPEQAAQR